MAVKTHNVSFALTRQARGVLVFPGGILPRMTIRGDAGQAELLRAEFRGPVPEVEEHDGTVTITYRQTPIIGGLLHPPRPAEITLNTSIPWRIQVRGGAGNVVADLREVTLEGLEMEGGTSDLELTLGRPNGTIPLHITKGLSDVSVLRPDGVPVRLHVAGGVSDLVIDRQEFGAVGHGMQWETPGYEQATSKYDIHASGGVSDLSVRTFKGGGE